MAYQSKDSYIKIAKQLGLFGNISNKNKLPRLLGIDPGIAKVGLSISDQSNRYAYPLKTILRREIRYRGDRHILSTAQEYARENNIPYQHPTKFTHMQKFTMQVRAELYEHNAIGICMGLPLTLKGEHGQSTGMSIRLATGLKQYGINVPIFLWDERYTTETAKIGIDLDEHDVDTIAAVHILQDFLDHLHRLTEEEEDNKT